MAVETVGPSPQQFLQLVGDPHRWKLLVELARSDRRVAELTELLGTPQNLVSYHLAELRKAGLVRARRSSADRRDTYYRAELIRYRDLLAASGVALHPGLRVEPVRSKPVVTGGGRSPLVLFLCSGNSARSQMAEGLLEHLSDRSIRARSAGSHPKDLHPNAVRVMAEHGIDISGRTTKHMGRFARTRFDRVITLCDKVREICPEFPGHASRAHWSMADPAAVSSTDEDSYPAFCQAAEELEVRIALLIGQLNTQPNDRRPHAS